MRGRAILGYPGTAVPQASLDAVLEGFAGQIELVSPGEGQLPAVGLEGAIVSFRRTCTVEGGKFRTHHDHIRRITAIDITGEGQAAVQEVGIDTDIIRSHFLPGQAFRNRGRLRGVVGFHASDNHTGLIHTHGLQEGVGSHGTIAQGAPVCTDLEVVQPAAGPFHKRFFAQAPSEGSGREEAPLLGAREFGGTVIAGRELGDIPAEERIVGTAEETDDAITGVILLHFDVGTVEEFERFVFLREEHTLALEIEPVVLVIFQVPTAHYVQFMVLAELRRPGSHDIGRKVIRIIGPAGLVGRLLGHIVGRLFRSGIEGKRSTVTLSPAADGPVAEVTFHLQDILDDVQGKRRGGGEGQVGIVLARVALQEGGIGSLAGCQGEGTVGVIRNQNRLSVLVHLVTDEGTGGKHRLGLLAAEYGGIVLQGEPVVDLDTAFGAEVERVVVLLANLIDTILSVIAAGDVVIHLFAVAAHTDVVGLGTIVTFVEEVQPVGVAIVQELSLAAQRITGGIIGKDTVFIVFHPLGAGSRDGAVRVQVRGTGHGHILRIDRGRHFAGSTGDTGIIAIEIIESFQPLQTIAHNVVFPLDQTLIERIGAAIRHGHFVTLGFLRGHEDHTVGSAGTVNSGGGSVLQNGNRFDIIRVHLAQGAFHTVDEHQGAAAVTDTVTGTAGACRTRTGVIRGIAATDVHATGVAGLTIGLDNVQTGNLALQGTRHIAVGTVGENFAVEVFDGTHQLGFLQGTITHHHRGFQGLRILKEDKIHFGTAIQRFLNGLVSKKLTNQDGRRGGLD